MTKEFGSSPTVSKMSPSRQSRLGNFGDENYVTEENYQGYQKGENSAYRALIA